MYVTMTMTTMTSTTIIMKLICNL